jgi:NADP-reducing hydrogenase subunit HndB
MSKLTLNDLRKLREQTRKDLSQRDTGAKDAQIVVGMGTCGIAAGAKETLNAIVDAVAAKGLANVLVRQTGCMGLCHSEPTVEVIVPGMPTVIYGCVKADLANQIVEQHVAGKRMLDHFICDRPAVDVMKG